MNRTDRADRRFQLAAAVLVAVALSAPPAVGDPTADSSASEKADAKARAEAKVAEGARLFAEGRFAPAIERYRAAEALYPSPKISYNIALAYLGMGKRGLAMLHLERFVREAHDAAPEYLAGARAELKRLAAEMGFVEVACDTEGADVLVDGMAIGSTPLRARVPVEPGRHELVVQSKTWGKRSKVFTAAAKQSVKVSITFRSDPLTGAASPRREHPGADRETGSLAAAGSDAASSAAPAPQAGASQAEALIREATELRRAGKDARAYPLLMKAYEVETTPRTAAQLGLVEMQLGYWLLAERHLTEALAAVRDPWVSSNRQDLEKSLGMAKAAIGEVVIKGTPSGAEVLVNGKPSGRLPLTGPVRAGHGPVNIEVRAPGHASAFRSLNILGGHREQVDVALEPVGGLVRAAPSESRPSLDGNPRPGDEPPTSPGRDRFRAMARPLVWTSAGLAAGALGFGVYESVRWNRKLDEFNRHTTSPAAGQPARRDCGVDETGHGGPACDSIYSEMRRARSLAFAGYLVGGLLAAGAVTLLVMDAGEPDDRSMGMACAPAPSITGAACLWTF